MPSHNWMITGLNSTIGSVFVPDCTVCNTETEVIQLKMMLPVAMSLAC